MRSRRHKLQVSTFPFLAVLLFAMGALLLGLLVMDRRAHAAALARAEQALQKQVGAAATDAGGRRRTGRSSPGFDARRLRLNPPDSYVRHQRAEQHYAKVENTA